MQITKNTNKLQIKKDSNDYQLTETAKEGKSERKNAKRYTERQRKQMLVRWRADKTQITSALLSFQIERLTKTKIQTIASPCNIKHVNVRDCFGQRHE